MSERPAAESGPEDEIVCARCHVVASRSALARSGYSCTRCALELAHLDTAPNGTVRGVIGWLRPPGTVLKDRYRIVELLGRGGFAVTYLVEDLLLGGKRRALKEVPEILFDEAETQILSRVQHPAVPDITDRFGLEGMIYLVLEFGGSHTLEGVRRRAGGRVEIDRLGRWVGELCDVLAYLHEQDPPIVHRDLKPENILLDESDRIMIIDFGIAKTGGEGALTRTIARSVSHGFGPPEQALGTGTDERSDVYSLAATIYALLTGEPPPPAHQRVSGAEIQPPSRAVPQLPGPLDEVLLRALNLNILKRPASIREFQRHFFEALGGASAGGAASAAQRTVAIDRLNTTAPVRTGAAPRTGGASASAALHATGAHALPAGAPRRPRRLAAFAGAGAALALAAALLWYFARGPGLGAPEEIRPDEEVPPVATAPSAPEGVPAPPAPVLAPQAPEASGSALAALEQARAASVEPPAPEPTLEPAPRRDPAPEPRPEPKPKPEAASGGGDWTMKVKKIERTR